MKNRQLACILIALGALVACNNSHKSILDTELDKYQVVKIAAPDLSDITDNGKECLNLYKFAAMQADEIYKKQAFSDPAALAGKLLELQAEGDEAAASEFISKYSSIGKDLEADFINLRLEKIPIDIRFEYEW